MKKSKHPRFRSVVRRGKGGQIWTYYRYDMRGTGKPDINLGTDYAAALERWHTLHNHLPLTIGRVQQAIDRFREECLPLYKVKGTQKSYKSNLLHIEAVFGQAGWHEITLPSLVEYLSRRTSKSQGNREMALLSILWGKARIWGMTQLHWPAMGVKNWRNKENKRQVEVTDEMFNAVYEQADRLLRDSMDIATATGMRITDVRAIRMPVNGIIRFKASKTGKWAQFDIAQSPVLTELVKRREAMKAHSVMLLSTNTGRQATERMLLGRWNKAKGLAAIAHPEIAEELKGLLNRDMRKRAADLADDLAGASKLLQHSNQKITEDHYRTKPTKLVAVR